MKPITVKPQRRKHHGSNKKQFTLGDMPHLKGLFLVYTVQMETGDIRLCVQIFVMFTMRGLIIVSDI